MISSSTRSHINHDVTHSSGSIEVAAQQTKARQFIVVAVNDHLVNPPLALAWAKAIHAQTHVSTGDCGLRITECEAAKLTSAVRDFLVAP
jgi:hypothetical protein